MEEWTEDNYKALCKEWGIEWAEESDKIWRQACREDAARDAAFQDDMRRG